MNVLDVFMMIPFCVIGIFIVKMIYELLLETVQDEFGLSGKDKHFVAILFFLFVFWDSFALGYFLKNIP